MSYHVHLQKFEGPLGLLLYLIRKEEMDIFDININEITKQYLDYIRMMKELDLEIAGDFVAMAATLLQIKSRMLLPQYNEEGEVVETEDPRKELVQKLLEYQSYRDAGKKLYDRPLLNRDLFPRGIRESLRMDEELGEIILEDDGLFSLINAYRRALRKMSRAVHQVRSKSQSIGSRIMELKDRLLPGRRLVFSELITLTGPKQRVQILITFLSLLELGRMGFVSLFQAETYGEIHVEVKQAVERNVLERVQEFESTDANDVAKRMMEIAEREAAFASADAQHESAVLALEAGESAENLDLFDSENAPVGAVNLVENRDLQEETFESLEMASDDEIFAAELELENMDVRAVDVKTPSLIDATREELSTEGSVEVSDLQGAPAFDEQIG